MWGPTRNVKRLAAVLASVFLLTTVTSSGTSPANAQSIGGFAVSPPTAELAGNPGDKLTRKIDVYNNADVPQEFAADLGNFVAGGVEGDQPVFTNEPTGFEMATWMSISPKNATIAPNGGSITVTLTVDIPKDASPGGHYGAVTFHPSKLSGTGEVKIDPAVTSLILVNVSGAVTEEMSIAKFEAQTGTGIPSERKSKFVFTEGPIDFAVSLRNDGNTAQKPIVTVRVTDQFGAEVANLKVDQPGNTLPKSTRVYRTLWDERSPFGIYTAEATVTYGKEGKAISSKTSFRAAPQAMFFAIGIAIVAIILLTIRRIIRKRRESRVVGTRFA